MSLATCPVCSLALLLLLPGWSWEGRADTHCLWYNFTINPNRGIGQPWCEFQGHVDQNIFLDYFCGTENFKTIDPLGKKANTTVDWKGQTETLKYMAEELKDKLPNIDKKIFTTSGPLTLQGTLFCLCETNDHTRPSWEFSFSGQRSLFLDLDNGNWTVVNPRATGIKEKWENDGHVTTFLQRNSKEVCSSWREDILQHWERMPETTAPPTTAPGSAHSKAMTITPSPWVLLVILICYVLLLLEALKGESRGMTSTMSISEKTARDRGVRWEDGKVSSQSPPHPMIGPSQMRQGKQDLMSLDSNDMGKLSPEGGLTSPHCREPSCHRERHGSLSDTPCSAGHKGVPCVWHSSMEVLVCSPLVA
ncbi:UL16-binding protein 1-like [Cynocephalus volans]|uniref:UL16-binding protein 1-like n=1 Tax=Cynocephalus volans TaxID=110931 RepID=UPI002FCC5392